MSDLPIIFLGILGLSLVIEKTKDHTIDNKDDIRELMYHRHFDFSSKGGDSTGMPINAEGRLLHDPTRFGSGIRGWY